ncbi:hypothetical protein FKW77_002620 [Venturia effusa]|uniref:DUF1763-domain-containing protein n=1 Tax=Venturia effusa TaxID=50376 RepID=A0A517LC35_9PEZI|nr:hypothetical protein FKW77_002620 [Venturia effusa]
MHRTPPKLTSLASTLQKLNTPPTLPINSLSNPTSLDILHAYRNLLRTSLRAVHYSTPARHILLSRLRLSFRSSTLSDFEPQRISNTLEFLRNAAASRGIEHKILRNLLYVWYWEPVHWRKKGLIRDHGKLEERVVKEGSYEGFYWSLRMLNESMGLCIR